jgi:RNA polymerase sigma-70 factor (ECF subfamily)
MRPDADADLVRRLKAGADGAYEELVRAHGPRMMLVIRRFLPRENDAEDALQDAFLNVFRSIGRFAGESRLTTWLHRVAVNAAVMRIRTRARRPETLMDETSFDRLPAADSVAAPHRTDHERPVGDDARALVRRSLDRLHEDARTVVELRDVYGIEVPEISRLVGVGISTIKSRLRRGRTTLRAALQSEMGEVMR